MKKINKESIKKQVNKKDITNYLNRIRDYFISNKKICIIVLVFIIVVILYNIFPRNYNSYFNNEKDFVYTDKSLEITHKNGINIELDNFKHSFKAQKEIIIKNNSNEPVIYNVNWRVTKNTLKDDANFTYKIEEIKDEKVKEEQIPKTSTRVFYKEKIKSKDKKVYKITFNYKKKPFSNNSAFKGYLDIYVYDNKTNKSKAGRK